MPSFNVGKALGAGYTPDEILAFLATMPAPTGGLSDEALIERQLGGKPMLPVEYLPQLPPPALPEGLRSTPQTLGRNPRTGLPMTEGYIPLLDDPIEGLTQTAGGWDAAHRAETRGQRAGALSEMVRGGMRTLTPLLPAAFLSAPINTLAGLAMGSVTGMGTEEYLRRRGVDPGYAALGGDVAGFAAGGLAAEAPWQTLPDLMRAPRAVGQRGAIEVSPSTGWTSTLRDLVEAKAPERIQPQQLAGIAAQASPEEVRWTNLGELVQAGKGPMQKGEVLSNIVQPEIQEVLRTPPDTKYSQWTLPGGDVGSRELLLTVPNKQKLLLEQQLKAAQSEMWEASHAYTQLNRKTQALPIYERAKFHPELERLAAAEEAAHTKLRTLRHHPTFQAEPGFQSGHWDEPNVLAHTRFTGRETPQGESVLFLEELQSDWHQAGREKGYHRKVDPAQITMKRIGDGDRAYWESFDDKGDLITRHPGRMTQEQAMQDAQIAADLPGGKPPDAPFAKDWQELLMKRMLREAVDKNYDKLAWTTGEQQAARYNLAKQVDSIRYSKEEGRLWADKDGDTVFDKSDVSPDKLAEYIGRDKAKQLIERPIDPHTYDRQTLAGEDLAMGGEGMKGFYDKILPDFARKYGKKFGSKVSQSEIVLPGGQAATVHSMDITPGMRTAIKEGQPMFGTATPAPRKKK